jgi:hypothetical protein
VLDQHAELDFYSASYFISPYSFMSSKHLCLASYTWPLSQVSLALRGNSEKSMEDIYNRRTSSENIKFMCTRFLVKLFYPAIV